MFKLLITAAFLATGTAAVAETWECDAYSKLVAGNAAKSGAGSQRASIVDSWIPSQFELTDEHLAFANLNPLPLSVRTEKRASAHRKARMDDDSSRGYRTLNVRYEITLNREKMMAFVTMRSKGMKTMGPVVFNCTF